MLTNISNQSRTELLKSQLSCWFPDKFLTLICYHQVATACADLRKQIKWLVVALRTVVTITGISWSIELVFLTKIRNIEKNTWGYSWVNTIYPWFLKCWWQHSVYLHSHPNHCDPYLQTLILKAFLIFIKDSRKVACCCN